MEFLIIFVAVGLIACQTKAAMLDYSSFEEDSPEAADLESCEERICSRVFSPICVAINGEATTLASMCRLANLRCELVRNVLKSTDFEMPTFQVLYFGECEE